MWLIDAVEGATTKVVEERKILSGLCLYGASDCRGPSLQNMEQLLLQ